MIVPALAAALAAAALLPQPVTPITPVPRYGPGSPVYTEPDRYGVAPDGAPYARPNAYRRPSAYGSSDTVSAVHPYGSRRNMLASGQVGPTCMGQLWPRGLHAVKVDCPLYLPARPGAVGHCVARDRAGLTSGVRVTVLDWDPATRRSSISCTRE